MTTKQMSDNEMREYKRGYDTAQEDNKGLISGQFQTILELEKDNRRLREHAKGCAIVGALWGVIGAMAVYFTCLHWGLV